jgi:hypothetical protein
LYLDLQQQKKDRATKKLGEFATPNDHYLHAPDKLGEFPLVDKRSFPFLSIPDTWLAQPERVGQ